MLITPFQVVAVGVEYFGFWVQGLGLFLKGSWKLETVGYLATWGHEVMYVGVVQFDIVIVVGLKFLQEAGRVCIYVCVCVYAFGIIWGV
jgi:hypothetical protein